MRDLPDSRNASGGKLAAWGGVLTEIAAGYMRGDAAVDPAKPDTCNFCELPPLCRIRSVHPAEA